MTEPRKCNYSINKGRLLRQLELLGDIGGGDDGVNRLALTDADKAGRDYIVARMKALGLNVTIDCVGNIFGRRDGRTDAPGVMTGSHIDSVKGAGKLDGCLGVLAGLEIIERLNELKIETHRSLTIGVFTNEEGARFQPDMLGSLVFARGMSVEEAYEKRDGNGVALGDELERIGYKGASEGSHETPFAFVELHIEQGPVLEEERQTIGVVRDLQGISWTDIEIAGTANHAGTTPMRLRSDAGYAAGRIIQFARDITSELGGSQVGTVGSVQFKPNLINVVPSKVRMTMDLRNTDEDKLRVAEKALDSLLINLEKSEGVSIKSARTARFAPVTFDRRICSVIRQSADEFGLKSDMMTSGAGHDAQMLARICPTAMIFIPSINGISHNHREASHAKDIEAGANVLFSSLMKLCAHRGNELDQISS